MRSVAFCSGPSGCIFLASHPCRVRLLLRRVPAQPAFSLLHPYLPVALHQPLSRDLLPLAFSHQIARRLCRDLLLLAFSLLLIRRPRRDMLHLAFSHPIAFSDALSLLLGRRLEPHLLPPLDGLDRFAFSSLHWCRLLVFCPLFPVAISILFSPLPLAAAQPSSHAQTFYPSRRTIAFCTIQVFGHFPERVPLPCHVARRTAFGQRRAARLSAASALRNSPTAAASDAFSSPQSFYSFFSLQPSLMGSARFYRSVRSQNGSLPRCDASRTPCVATAFNGASAECVHGTVFSNAAAPLNSSSTRPRLPPPPSSPAPSLPLLCCPAPPFFSGEAPRGFASSSSCSSSSASSCASPSSSFLFATCSVSGSSDSCPSAHCQSVSLASPSSHLLHPLPLVPRVQHAWIPAASHWPGGSWHPLRVIPAFGGRSKKQVSLERDPERVFSSSGGGHGTGYWRSHRPQKQRSQRLTIILRGDLVLKTASVEEPVPPSIGVGSFFSNPLLENSKLADSSASQRFWAQSLNPMWPSHSVIFPIF